jgi:SAM-dependent methyltransferase
MRLEDLNASDDGRLASPSAERNREPIAEVLAQVLPQSGLVLEVGSGTGEHAVHFARAMPHLTWQPSEQDAACLRSISSWIAVEAQTNVRPPLSLDVANAQWPIAAADAIVCINMIHIAPWSVAQALLRGASRVLPPGGLLCLYGPYCVAGILRGFRDLNWSGACWLVPRSGRLECHAPVQLAVGTILKLSRPAEMKVRMPRLTDRPTAVVLLKVEQFLWAFRLLGFGLRLRCHDAWRSFSRRSEAKPEPSPFRP